MLWPKINSYKEFDNEKTFLRLENSPPSNNFSNGPSIKTKRPLKFSNESKATSRPRTFDRTHKGSLHFRMRRKSHLKLS